jgi:hypothetical protein
MVVWENSQIATPAPGGAHGRAILSTRDIHRQKAAMNTVTADIEPGLAAEAQEQLGLAIRRFMRERTAVESPLIDVAAKMVYGNYAAARTIPSLVDHLNERMSPEEIATRLKVLGIPVGLALYGMAWAYSLGRLQLFLDEGWPDRKVELPNDQSAKVMTWWARAMRVYRNDGGFVPGQGDAQGTFAILPQGIVDDLAVAAERYGKPHDPAPGTPIDR